ncbi:ion transporter [Rhodospira trueperi]|uniref:Voltage-gated potassium channel n=1 Tax=Rhodospira trueperi TaxID=69960 RepID=A0A1G7BIS6_9PROT|nr:ion transporter [Rhodospira trueperi]SDE26787.1 voltage-gated potassium channel [Rhodospira trueperi]
MSVRSMLARQLDPALREAPGLSPANWAVCGLIVAAMLVAVLETEPALRTGRETLFLAVEIGLTGLLALEYAVRVWVSVENPAYDGRLAYVRSPAAVFDLLTILVVLATAFGTEGFLLRLAMLLRVLRIARLGRFSKAFDAVAAAVASRSTELGLSVAFAGLLLLVSSAMLYLVEGAVQPESFGSIPRAMWWSVATLTTVGYGDVFPVTALGRVFAALTAITGIGLIAMPTGILASAFSDAFQAQRAAAERQDPGTETSERAES